MVVFKLEIGQSVDKKNFPQEVDKELCDSTLSAAFCKFKKEKSLFQQ